MSELVEAWDHKFHRAQQYFWSQDLMRRYSQPLLEQYVREIGPVVNQSYLVADTEKVGNSFTVATYDETSMFRHYQEEVGSKAFKNIVMVITRIDERGVEAVFRIESPQYHRKAANSLQHLYFEFKDLGVVKSPRKAEIGDSYYFTALGVTLLAHAMAPLLAMADRLHIVADNVNNQRVASVLVDATYMQLIFASVAKVAVHENRNMRYELGRNVNGYAPPSASIAGGISRILGRAEAYSKLDTKPANNAIFSWADSALDSSSKPILNASFGKESLCTHKLLTDFIGIPEAEIGFAVFQHGRNDYQSSYPKLLEKYRRTNVIRSVTSNFLDEVLEPYCDVRIGGPVCMLTHVFNLANRLAWFGMGMTHNLSGDEYERNLPVMAQGVGKVYAYDYEQTPSLAFDMNELAQQLSKRTETSELPPAFGSLLYGITGYQAQLLLDKAFKYTGPQLSCHAAHKMGDKNCNRCQKCKRINFVKYGARSALDGIYNHAGDFQIDSDILAGIAEVADTFDLADFYISYTLRDYTALCDTRHILTEQFKAWLHLQATRRDPDNFVIESVDGVAPLCEVHYHNQTHPWWIANKSTHDLRELLQSAIAEIVDTFSEEVE